MVTTSPARPPVINAHALQMDAIKLAVRALSEVVESGSKSIDIAVIEKGKPLTVSAT